MNNDLHPAFQAEHQYLSLLREILSSNGITEESMKEDITKGVTPDRTGTGRIRLFSRQIRVDLSEGYLPVVTTRKVNYQHAVDELIWMISGSSNIKDLHDSTKVIWKDWAIEEKHIDAFIAKHFPENNSAAAENLKKNLLERHEGSIGPMYGQFWRNNDSLSETIFLPFDSLLMEDIPSDKLKRYSEEYDEIQYFHKLNSDVDDTKELPPKDFYIKKRYFESNDQLGEIIRGIKRRPYSARHVMSSWIPGGVPFESVLSPHENVIIGRGALTSCHILSHFFVQKASDGGPDYISLHMYQRSCDMVLGVCTNLNFYSTLLYLVAHCCNLRPKEFTWSGGDCHIYANHLVNLMEQLKRRPFAAPKIRINPDKKDLFAMTRDDIELVDYQHHPFIKYPVST